MPTISIGAKTFAALVRESETSGESLDGVITRLLGANTPLDQRLDHPQRSEQESGPESEQADPVVAISNPTALTTSQWLAIYTTFKGERVDASFNPSTMEVKIVTEPWSNRYFSSPTAAAVAVVAHFAGNSRESNNTNGRKFWKVASTGQNLRSIVGQR